MRKPLPEILSFIEKSIRLGRGSDAKRTIRELMKRKIDRGNAATLAKLARRADLPLLGLRLLKPYVRSDRKKTVQAHTEEKIEYAACLIYIGASEEATAVLETLNGVTHPRVHLFRGFALVTEWNYGEAIPFFLKYMRHPSLDSYSQMIGKANLAEACIYEGQYKKAEPILQCLLHESSVRKLHLLLGKALELSAQNFLMQGKLDRAGHFLDRAGDYLRTSKGLDEYFVRKWKAILGLKRESGSSPSLRNLHSIRREGLSRGHWESVRSCDHFEAMVRKDGRLLMRVYFGTPYRSYRERLLRDFGKPITVPSFFDWDLREGDGSTPPIELSDLESGLRNETLRQEGLLCRFLTLLSSDFYHPFRLAKIHAWLYPGEYFNPVTSPARVHNVIKRIREWLTDSSLPLYIEEKDGFYRLAASAPCTIRITGGGQAKDDSDSIARLRERFRNDFFSSAQTSKVLGISYRATLRLLADAVERGVLRRVGIGSATRYRFGAVETDPSKT